MIDFVLISVPLGDFDYTIPGHQPKKKEWLSNRFGGGNSARETPGPIPNPEAKPGNADGTALERAWESKKPPPFKPIKTNGAPNKWSPVPTPKKEILRIMISR